MFELPGYKIQEKLFEGTNTRVYRALQIENTKRVILKVLKAEYIGDEHFIRYQHEFEISKNLQYEEICKTCELLHNQQQLIIVQQDIGGQSLKQLISSYQFGMEEIFELTTKICNGLARIHASNIIHQDINPSNIIYNPETKELNIIDFGLSTKLNKRSQNLGHPKNLEGTLHYISPEQTGRINRSIDYRTDFYSLGVSLFELCSGKLPFDSEDTLELIHSHIALEPPTPSSINPDIPVAFENIILKLLAKNPEQRYFSAVGLKKDIEKCYQEYTSNGNIIPFKLGQQDKPVGLKIPEKLYGREKEIETILETFEECKQGYPQILLISGYSGIGKTSLVRELYKPLTDAKGIFISGKYDQFNKDKPFSALSSALTTLVNHLLAEDDRALADWKRKILKNLGSNGQILIDIIPELEHIIGPQEKIEYISPDAERNRFISTCQAFISTFSTAEHPLIIFLDDLQWIDYSSLSLLEIIFGKENNNHLLFIGAYRKNEVSDGHPLLITMNQIKDNNTSVHTLDLPPLTAEDIENLLSDTLYCKSSSTRQFAEVLMEKTAGNPFFIGELLRLLYRNNLLLFDPNKNAWTWSIKEINKHNISDNIVEVLTEYMSSLSLELQNILGTAACIGNTFSLGILSKAMNLSPDTLKDKLWQASKIGFIIPLSDTRKYQPIKLQHNEDLDYKFSHDRIQQASYSLIPKINRPKLHLIIGQFLLQQSEIYDDGEQQSIFDISNHLNKAKSLLSESEKQTILVKLNYKAGKQALKASAYTAALEYFENVYHDLTETTWEKDYEFRISFSKKIISAAYLCGNYAKMDQHYTELMQRCKNIYDISNTHEYIISSYMARDNIKDAYELSLRLFKLYDIKIPKYNFTANILYQYLKCQFLIKRSKLLQGKEPVKLNSKKYLAKMAILKSTTQAVYFANPKIVAPITLNLTYITSRYGFSSYSPVSLMGYSILLSSRLKKYQQALQLAQVAIKLSEKPECEAFKGRTRYIYNLMIRHWSEPFSNAIDDYRDCYKSSLEYGDNEFAAYAIVNEAYWKYYAGSNLTDVYRSAIESGKIVKNLKFQEIHRRHLVFSQTIANLIEENKNNPLKIRGHHFKDEFNVQEHINKKQITSVLSYLSYKMDLAIFFSEYDIAYQCIDEVIPVIDCATGTPAPIVIKFKAVFSTLIMAQQNKIRKSSLESSRFKSWINTLQNASRQSPYNYLHFLKLILAEQARLDNQFEKCVKLYQHAFLSAQENNRVGIAALAYERLADLFFEKELPSLGETYILESADLYGNWGAKNKVLQLKQKFPLLALGNSSSDQVVATLKTRPTTIQNNLDLDMHSLFKATQTISDKMELRTLNEQILLITRENAGATSATVLLYKGETLFIEARSEPGRNSVSFPQIEAHIYKDLPLKVINQTSRLKTEVVIHDAEKDVLFKDDPYIAAHHCKSLLCLPIITQSDVIGILLLENSNTTQCFTPERVAILQFLSSQAAISLKNAQLFEKLYQSEQEYRGIFENSLEGIIRVSSNREILFANKEFSNLLGYNSRELCIRDLNKENALDRRIPKLNYLLSKAHRSDKITNHETEILPVGKEKFQAFVNILPVLDVNNRVSSFTVFIKNVSEWRKSEQLRRDKEIAETAVKAKGEFLAGMSHEIRTPMNGIVGILQLIKNTHLDEQQRYYFDLIQNSSQAMLDIINDILDFSKIEAGRMELEAIEFDIEQLLTDCASLFSIRSSEKNIPLFIEIDSTVQKRVIADPTRIRQIILNLISNALKFTECGQILVRISSPTDNLYKIQVEDSGIGISAKNQDQLFKAYSQAGAHTARKYGGTGLGLTICEKLSGLLGGKIGVDSEEDVGSKFWFTFKVNILNSPPSAFNKNISSVKMAIIFPNENIHNIIRSELKEQNIIVHTFMNYEEFSQCGHTDQFQIIFIDLITQPIPLELIGEKANSNATKIIFTAPDKSYSKKLLAKMDIAEAMARPVSSLQLLQAIYRHLFQQAANEDLAHQKNLIFRHPIKVLIAEDNIVNQIVVKGLFSHINANITIANTGIEALDLFEKSQANNEPYHLILMDCEMPDMDGYEATKKIRSYETSEQSNRTPIIALTAHVLEDQRKKCLAIGMDDRLSKPLKKDDLEKMILKYVQPEPSLAKPSQSG